MNQLLEPTFTSPDPRINIRQWNEHAEEHATRTGERVSDGIRRAVYMNKIGPQDMRQHLMLNQSRLSIAEEVAQEIEDYQDATKEFSRDDKGQAGFIALQLVKTLCKVGNLVECHTTLERVERRTKENGLGFQPERDVLVDTAIGAGESATRSRQCCFKQEYTENSPPQDPLQRDIREWSNELSGERARSQPAQR